MIGPLSLGDLLIIYSIVLVIYIILTEFELMEFRRARNRFNKVFGREEKELEKEEYSLLTEIKAIKALVHELHAVHVNEGAIPAVAAKPAAVKAPAPAPVRRPAPAKPPVKRAPAPSGNLPKK